MNHCLKTNSYNYSYLSKYCFYVLLLVVSCACFPVLTHSQDIQGVQSLKFGTIDKKNQVASMANVPFYLSGKKMYVVGMMDGSFPFDDNKTVERGVWTHPVKLLNSYGFTISEQGTNDWKLVHATSFEHSFYSAKMYFARNELNIVREDMVVENEQAVFSQLSISNKSDRTRKIVISFTSEIEIRPSWRAESLKDSEDIIRVVEDKIAANDNLATLVMGSSAKLKSSKVVNNRATLEYDLKIPANETVSLPFLMVSDNNSGGDFLNTNREFDELFHSFDALKEEKFELYNNSIFGDVNFNCSNKQLTDAYYCAKANVLMGIRDSRPFFNDLFIGAGVPVYPRLFGTYFCFSVAGLISSGFNDISKRTLNAIASYSQEYLRAPHEVSSEGKLLGWDHIQVSLQFITSSWEYFAWTKDSAYLDSVYPLCNNMLGDILKIADKDHDQYIEGHGLMEERMFKNDWEELTTSAFLYPALLSLSKMAEVMKEQDLSDSYRQRAQTFKNNFNRDWWGNERSIWATAMSNNGEKRFDNFWSVTFPQKTGLADAQKGQIAMENINNNWVNDSWGMLGKYESERDQSEDGVGMVHNNLTALSAFKYGKGNLAWKLLQLSTKGALELNSNQLGLFPECHPNICSNISQLWSYGPFLEAIISGLMGINPVESSSQLEIYPFFPDGLESASLSNVKIGKDRISINWTKTKGKIKINLEHSEEVDLNVVLRVEKERTEEITINGKKINFDSEIYYGAAVNRSSFVLEGTGEIKIN